MRTISTIRKIGRKEAYIALLASKLPGSALTEKQTDGLLAYFAPALPRVPKTVEQWCAKACATDDVREYLHFLHVSAGEVLGCDGHRIHWGVTELDDGAYCPRTMLRVVHGYKVPDFDRVKYLARAAKHEAYVAGDGVPRKLSDSSGLDILDFGKRCRIVAKYLADAVGKNADGAELTVEPGDAARVAGSTVWGRFLIMGMRK